MNNTVKSLGLILLTIILVTACNPAAQPQNQSQPYQYDQADPYYEGDNRYAPYVDARSYHQLFPYGQASTYDAVEPYDRAPQGRIAGNDQLTPRNGVIRPFDNNFPRQGDGNLRQNRGQDNRRGGLLNQGQDNQAGGALNQAQDNQGDRDQNTGTKSPQSPNRKNRDAQKVAQRLVSLATKVDDVNDATAIVAGRWAIIGIDVNAKLDRARVGSIKYSVAEALKADPKGAYAIVTADIDTNYRLRQMAQEIREGKPIAGVMDELAAIVGRLMPQVPRQVQDPDTADENAENKAKTQGQKNQSNKQQKNNTSDKNS